MADDAAFLSPEWLDLQREVFAELPQHGGESARVQYTVTGAPEGEAAYWVVYEDGRLTDAGIGDHPGAAVTIAAPYALAAEVATGQVEAGVAFMQGRTKVTGDQRELLRVLALMATPGHRAALRRLADRTRL